MIRKVVLAILSCTASVPAIAQEFSYGWCEVDDGNGTYRMSALLQTPKKGSSDPVKRAFESSLGTSQRAECWLYYSSPSDAKSHFGQRQYVITSQEKKRTSLTGWTGPYAVTGEPAAPPSGAYLTVTETSVTEPGWDAKVREGQRRDAAGRIRAAAGTEKMRQESQAALAKLLAELRKRGSAQ